MLEHSVCTTRKRLDPACCAAAQDTQAHGSAPAASDEAALMLAALTIGLDRLSYGVALLQVDGRVAYANTAALAQLSELGWPAQPWKPPALARAWAHALEQVCLRGRHEYLGPAEDQHAGMVVLAPIVLSGKGMAFTVFGRSQLCEGVELQMFALQHQLTHAETLVLRQLCEGLTARDIALVHGVARTTVLTQIAAIRAKTGSASVRHLLRTMARMPPVRAAQMASHMF